ncbi:MAG: universal stress protein [Pseudomonadota bacterium]
MHTHILIPVALDHEDMVPKKLEVARRMLADGGRITLLTVLENVPGFVAEFVDLKPENHLSAHITEKLGAISAGAADISTAVVKGKAGVEIAAYAQENGVDMIIVGSHHPTATDYFLGSTASRVARRAPCSVYILRS